MYTKYFLLLLISTLSYALHDIPIAFFNVEIHADNHIGIDMEFHKKDIDKIVALTYKQTASIELIERYILKHSKWRINNQALNVEICDIKDVHGHYYVKTQLAAFNGTLKNINIHNSCLVKHIPTHVNVVNIQYQGKKRSFKLSQQRLNTSIDY